MKAQSGAKRKARAARKPAPITPKISLRRFSDFRPDPRNVNQHTPRGQYMVEASQRAGGFARPAFAAEDGTILGGNLSFLEVAPTVFGDEVVEVVTDGTRPVVHRIAGLDSQSTRALDLSIADNRAAAVSWNPDISLLNALPPEIQDKYWTLDEKIEWDLTPKFARHPFTRRTLPIDVIYTVQGADVTCCLAAEAGILYGIQSAQFRLCPYTNELSGRHEVAFIDCDYQAYDHARHREIVARFRPRYCTVRDIMDRQQCLAAGIPYYDLSQIIEWAHDLAQYAISVILIPKYDCLDRLPPEFILGYSVPSSHGQTPLPIEAFRGRWIHLLGGSWKSQLDLLNLMGESIVSLDNNQIALIASNWAQYVTPDGDTRSVKDSLGWVINPRYVAMAISFGSIGAKVQELYGKRDTPRADDPPADSQT